MRYDNGKRIKELALYKASSQRAFALSLGVSTQVFANWVSRGVGPATLLKICEVYPDVNFEWLSKGEGNMLLSKNKDSQNTSDATDINIWDKNDYRLVPQINIDSVGGLHSGNAITDEPQYVVKMVPFVGARDGDVCITESGESMSPTIPPGALLLLRNVPDWREHFGYGNIFVIVLKDGRRITKEVQRYSENPKEYVLCHSHNPNVQDEELPKSMILAVWKVVKVLIDKGY